MTTNADTNQPTEATIANNYSQPVSPKVIAQHFEVAVDLAKEVQHLTAQLAAAQAEVKAWEAWGENMYKELNKYGFIDEVVVATKPQPVDASSLARIARVALEADKKTREFREWAEINFSHTLCPDFEQWFSDKYFDTDEDQALDKSCQHITPNDIALCKALTGGA